MRICFWGTYTVAEGYPVNRVLAKGLRQAGAQVEEVREQIWDGFLHSISSAGGWTSLRLVWRAAPAYARLAWHFLQSRHSQVVVVGYAGYIDIILARLLTVIRSRRRRRPLVLVAFISLYDTLVVDREQASSSSWKAALLRRIDRAAFEAADLVLVDTEEHRQYFARLFGVPVTRFHRSFVGDDDEIFRPQASRGPGSHRGERPFQVLFFGTYVPLHGIEFILAAAEILRDESGLEFVLVGNGQQYPQMRRLAKEKALEQIRFVEDWVSTGELVDYINACDLCLGIFGITEKAARVVPYKVFDALAVGKPVITRDSAAARELLEHEETALLCNPGDGVALAAAIRRLRSDEDLRERLAVCGRERYLERGSPGAIGRDLLATLEERFGD